MLTEHIYVSFNTVYFKIPWMEGLILDRFISALPCILDEFEYSRKHTPVIVIPIPHQLYRTNNTRQTLRQVWSQLHIATHEKKKICPAYFAVYTQQRLWKVFANEISVTSNKFDIGVSHSYLLAGAMLDNIQWAVLFVYILTIPFYTIALLGIGDDISLGII